jgi:aryl sulfotransferase
VAGEETQGSIAWPVKRRELVKFVVDSRKWNNFQMRDGDIVICTWSKAGTNWLQQVVGQLVFGGAEGIFGSDVSPWIDFRLAPDEPGRAAAMTHRRVLKTHLPIDTNVYSPKAKYIYIGRDGRDTYWSWHNHHANFTPEVLAEISALYPDEPPIGHPNPDIRLAFLDWLDRDAYPNWPFWPHIQGWFDARDLPNLKLVHFANLKADLAGQIDSIAKFLEIPIDPARRAQIIEHCTFDYMRQTAIEENKPDPALKGAAATFFHKGTNGRWRDVLTADDIARYEAEVGRHLTPEAAVWLETGRLPGDGS